MPTVCTNHTAILGFGVLLNDIAKFSNQNAWLHSLDGFVQTLSCSFHNSDIIWIRLRFIADIVCLVQIGMVSFVVQCDVDVEDIAIDKRSVIGNAVADDFIY